MSLPPLGPVNCSSGPLYGAGWDTATFGGVQPPGRCRLISGVGARYKLDPKKAKGQHGGFPTYHGVDAGVLDFEHIVWTSDQIDDLRLFCSTFAPSPKTVGHDPAPVVVNTPQLAHLAPEFSLMTCIEVSPIMFYAEYGVQGRRVVTKWQQQIAPASAINGTPKKGPVRKVALEREKPAVTNPAPVSQPGVGNPPLASFPPGV